MAGSQALVIPDPAHAPGVTAKHPGTSNAPRMKQAANGDGAEEQWT
jgi:hypothetical protein